MTPCEIAHVGEPASLSAMAKAKPKQGAVELGPDADPRVLYSNYVKECKAIGIEPYGPMKNALTNDENPNLGKQLIVLGRDDILGPGGCRALVNAMIGREPADSTSAIQVPFTAMKELRICSSNIQDAGAAAIGTLLSATASKPGSDQKWKLEYLELMDNGIRRDGCASLGRSLCVGMNKTLATLVLDFNPVGSDGVAALCKGISTNSTLKKLSLKHCIIDERGGRPIATMLGFKRLALLSLDLTSNSLGGAGLLAICDGGLAINTSLKTFRLGDNSLGQTDIDAKALETFASCLAKHNAIMAVDLMHNKIGTVGGTLLLPAVQDNKKITEFKVDASSMDDELFKALFRSGAEKSSKGKKKKKSKKK